MMEQVSIRLHPQTIERLDQLRSRMEAQSEHRATPEVTRSYALRQLLIQGMDRFDGVGADEGER